MATPNNPNHETENYGGKVAEQTDMANRALTYRGRFGTDENRDPRNAERNVEINRAQGNGGGK